MKKLTLTIGLLVGLVCAGFAGTNSLYNAKEFGLSLATGYGVKPSAPFQDPYSFNLSAGVHYFPTKVLGFEASVPFYQTKGASVEEVQAGVLVRLPVGFVSPYVGLGGVHNWNSEQDWAYVAKAGLEIRTNKKWGVFAEVNYRETDVDFDNGDVSVRGGLKFNF